MNGNSTSTCACWVLTGLFTPGPSTQPGTYYVFSRPLLTEYLVLLPCLADEPQETYMTLRIFYSHPILK